MSLSQSIILGIIQGITEFLPISSSGHLILVPRFLNWPDQGLAFDTIIHLATALAIVIALKKDIILFFASGKTIYLTILAIIPAGLVGFFMNNWIESNLRSPLIVAFSLILWGIILLIAEIYNNKKNNKIKKLEKINWRQSLIIGLMQILAFIPGTSRSGITITGGLFSGLNKQSAIKFSFLVGLPLILAAGAMQLRELIQTGINCNDWLYLTTGFFFALISGILSLKLLLYLAQKSFKIFVIYRIILGIIILLIF